MARAIEGPQNVLNTAGRDDLKNLRQQSFPLPSDFPKEKREGWLAIPLKLGEPLRANLVRQIIQREIQVQHIHARLAKKAERASLNVICNQLFELHPPTIHAPWQCAAPGSRHYRA